MQTKSSDPFEIQSQLTNEIGSHILSHRKYISREWDAIAVVVSIDQSGSESTGYIYLADEWEANTPSGREFRSLCKRLQDAMTPPGAKPWKQALIHITKPGPEINIQFEYDDPKRWSLKKVSLDLSDYAESLRPPRPE